MIKVKQYFANYLPWFSIILVIKGFTHIQSRGILVSSVFFVAALFWYYIARLLQKSIKKDIAFGKSTRLKASNTYTHIDGKLDDAGYYDDLLYGVHQLEEGVVNGWVYIGFYMVWLVKNNLYEDKGNDGVDIPHFKNQVNQFLEHKGNLFDVVAYQDFKLIPGEFTKVGREFSWDYYHDKDGDSDDKPTYVGDILTNMMLHGKVEGLAYNEFLKKNSIPAEVGPFALPPTPEIYHRIEPLLDRRFKEWKRTYKGTL